MICSHIILAIVTIENIKSNCRSVNRIHISDILTQIIEVIIDISPETITRGIKGDISILAMSEPTEGMLPNFIIIGSIKILQIRLIIRLSSTQFNFNLCCKLPAHIIAKDAMNES